MENKSVSLSQKAAQNCWSFRFLSPRSNLQFHEWVESEVAALAEGRDLDLDSWLEPVCEASKLLLIATRPGYWPFVFAPVLPRNFTDYPELLLIYRRLKSFFARAFCCDLRTLIKAMHRDAWFIVTREMSWIMDGGMDNREDCEFFLRFFFFF